MTSTIPDPPPELSEAAEEVRAYLVTLRGGGPFLSGADGRLLVDWLSAGEPVGAILAALDHAAERRARRPARSRLSLQSIKGEGKRSAGRAAPRPVAPARGAIWPAMAALGGEIAQMAVAAGLEPARADLAEALSGLGRGQGPDGALPEDPSGETVARLAIAACRRFQDAAWAAAAPEQEALLALALADLAGLADVLNADALRAAAEEVARDRVRARTPLVAARVVWDRLTGQGEA